MAANYFGQQSNNANNVIGGAITVWMPHTGSFTCPGTGNQTIVEISANVCSPGNIRLAVYNSNGTVKIAEGTANISVTGATPSWQGHMAQANITPNPANLVGGANYIIACTFNNANTGIAYKSPQTYDTDYNQDNTYLGGFPASLPASNGQFGLDLLLRCGVTPANAGGTSWLISGFRWDNPYFGRNQ